jgi:membrane-associated protein
VDVLDPKKLLDTVGTIGLLAVVFAESGLLIGFFLPGDSLLFTAGVLSAAGHLAPLPVLLIGCFAAAFLGDQVGYAFGNRVGPALFRRPDSKVFRQEYVEKAQSYFEKYGPKTIVLARFVPIVRTFVAYNAVGGALWAVGVTTLGYVLGEAVDIDKYLLPAIALIILASLVPVVLEVRKARRESAASTPPPVD